MILLPLARPAYLKSFSLAIGFLGALLMSLPAYWFAPRILIPFVAAPAIGFPLLGLLWPQSISSLYKLWNVAVNHFSRLARFFLMTICFYVVLLAVGRAGTSLIVTRPRPNESLWLAKKTLSTDTYRYEFAGTGKHFAEKGWVRNYLSWARTSRQVWAFCLIPLLAMLAAVEVYQDRRPPIGVYTLF